MTYKPIGSYGLIGDAQSAALVGTDGSIDWVCFPRFDSPSVFAAILDDSKGGRFQIAPAGEYESRQAYLPNTNVLAITFTTETGEVELIDFMPLRELRRPGVSPHEIHRLVRCTRGSVEMACLFQPRFDYARAETKVTAQRHGAVATSPSEHMALSASVPLEAQEGEARARFTLGEGETATFVLSYGQHHADRVQSFNTPTRLARNRAYWEALAEHISYEGPWKEQVVRSFLVLHLLIYSPTGAIVSAPTTSLPEEIGGVRNWDYRYCWLRDAAFTLDSLYRLGDYRDGHHFFRWLVHQCKVTLGDTRILYGIDPQSALRERTLDHLEGYRGSRPVRIGNGAHRHIQMDIFGEMVMSIATYHKYGGRINADAWSIVENFADVVCRNWARTDRSIWEVRGPRRHFIYSKVMCWVALDQAIKLARKLRRGRPEDVQRWKWTAKAIKEEVLTKGWSWRKQAFSRSYRSDDMDAAALIIPMVGFLPADDPRVVSTIQRIREELAQGVLVRRYDTATGVDGLPGGEGAFTMLSFWLIGALRSAGQVQEARDLFEEVLGYANHLGLFAEMVDPHTKEALGNFPQAFSHVGLIHTARNLAAVLAPGVQKQAVG